ncbi:hypothetical protein ACFLUN_00130 [Chloroflexota bacterium]
MLSKEMQIQIEQKMEEAAEEYMKEQVLKPDVELIAKNFENYTIAFSYLQSVKLIRLSENLVKSTDRLNVWTIVIVILSAVMIGTSIANLLH